MERGMSTMTGTVTTARITDLQVSADLIEDYEVSVHPPAGPDVTDRFAAVRRPTGTDLVSTHPEGGLVHLFADATAQSGWAAEQVIIEGAPQGAVPVSLRAYGSGSAMTVLSRFSGSQGDAVIGMQQTPDRGWEPVTLQSGLADALGAMTQTDVLTSPVGRTWVYGVSVAYDPPTLVVVDAASSGWQVTYLAPATAGTTYKLLPGADDESLVLVEISGSTLTFRPGTLGDGQWTFEDGTPVDAGVGALTADRVIPVPSAAGQQDFVVLTDDGMLMRLTYAAGAVSHTALTGGTGQPGAIQQHAVSTLDGGSVALFALDQAGDRLWLSDLGSDTWTPLGDLVTALAAPTSAADPEAFTFDQALTISHLARTGDAHLWSTTSVKSATTSTDPDPISTWAYEMIALDDLGQIVTGAPLSLTTSTPCVVTVAGLSSHTGPGLPVSVRTGADGSVSVSVRAESIGAPEVSLTSGEAGFGPFRADLVTHQRLAGADPSFPVDGATLTKHGVVPSSMDSDSADKIASSLRTLGGAAVSMRTQPGVPMPTRRVSMDFATVPDATDPQTLAALLAAAPDSVGSFFGDIVHFFSQLAKDIEHLVVEASDDVVKLAITIGGDIRHLVATTVDEVAHAVHLVLALANRIAHDIVAAIKTALKWLEMLFKWDDILDTKKVIHYFITQALTNVTDDLQLAGTKVSELAQHLETDVTDAFNTLIHDIDPNVGIGGMTPSSSSNPMLKPGHPLQAQGLVAAHEKNRTRCNYVKRRATPALASTPALELDADDDVLADLIKAIETALPREQLDQSWQQIRTATEHVSSAKDALELSLVVLLEAAKDLVLLAISAMEAIAEAAIALADGAITAILDLANKPIDIPVISWLYEKISGAPLCVLDLLSLLLALPVTILYKIFNDDQPPFPNPEAVIGKPIPWPGRTSAAEFSASVEVDANAWDVVRSLVFLMTMIGYAAEDMALDVAAATDAPPDKELTWFSMATVITEVAAQAFGYPSFDTSSEVETWSTTTWGIAWAPPILDAIATGLTAKKAALRTWSWFGPAVATATGAVLLGVGSKTVDEMRSTTGYNDWNQAEMLLPAFPLVLQWIVLLGADTPPTAAAQLGLLIVDAIGDMGTGVCKLAGTVS